MLLYLRRLLLTSLSVFMFFSTSVYSAELTQEERTQIAAQMIPIISIVLESASSSVLKKTGQTTSYYPNDDGDYQAGLTPSYSRANEVVTDHVTGLEWQDNAEAKTITKNWDDAQTHCAGLSLDGGGWRLPTVVELQSIVVDGVYNPSIDTTAFVNYTSSDYYWSSTTAASNTDNAWYVYFGYGDTSHYNKSLSLYVRCVRSGQ